MKEHGSYLSAVKGGKLGVGKTKLIIWGGEEEKDKREMLELGGERNKSYVDKNMLSRVQGGKGRESRLEA